MYRIIYSKFDKTTYDEIHFHYPTIKINKKEHSDFRAHFWTTEISFPTEIYLFNTHNFIKFNFVILGFGFGYCKKF